MGGANAAARRAAEAMVLAHGTEVHLEMPAPPVAGDDDEQIGLSSPQFQVRVLVPVAVRSTEQRVELLVAAEVLEDLLAVRGFGAVSEVMRTAFAAVVGDVRYRLAGTECVRAAGDVCLYRLVCVAVGTEVV